ncbi:hypothetical protein HC928_24210 [bacterium]|nr:hypothetical protein [bacterium]
MSNAPWKLKSVAFNNPIQAASGYVCLELFSFISEQLNGHQSVPCLTVHDSVYIDVHPEEKELVIQTIRDAFASLNHNPIFSGLPLWGYLPVSGGIESHPTLMISFYQRH